jgi:3-deoxy-7-phosphoheptulonate synthase
VGALKYGQSITDACLGWGDSLQALEVLSSAVQTARQTTA